MQEFRIYISAIVFATFASGILFMLIPKGRVPKYIRMTASISLLLLLISPIFKLSKNYKDIVSQADIDLPNNYIELEEIQRKQYIEVTKEKFSASVEDILIKNGITPISVHIYVTAEGEEIILYGISILLSSSTTAPEVSKAKRVITEVFALEPSIELER